MEIQAITPKIVDIILSYDDSTKSKNELYEHVLKNPNDLYYIHLDMPIYAFAGSISLNCLKTIHKAYLLTIKQKNLVKFFLNREQPIITKNAKGRTSLHIMIMMKDNDCVKYMLTELNAGVNITDNFGYTPLHLACQYSPIYIVRMLLKISGININSINLDNETALSIAVVHKRSDVCEDLLRAGANKNYYIGRFEIDIEKFVETKGTPEIKKIFKKYSKKPHQNKKKMLSQRINYFRQNYKELCEKQDEENIMYTKELANSLNIKYDNAKITQKDLCDKIKERIQILNINPKMYSKFFSTGF